MDETSPGETTIARDLLRELRDSARDLVHASPEERERLLEIRLAIRDRITTLPFDEEFADALREHLSHVGSRLELLEGLTSGEKTISLEILELRGDLSWLPMCLPEDPLGETMAALEAELGALETVAAELAATDDGRITSRLRDRASDLVDVAETRLTERAERVLADADATIPELWTAYLEARDLQQAGRDMTSLLSRLKSAISERAGNGDPAGTARALGRLAAEYEDRALDLLAAQSEMETGQAAANLETGKREIDWLRGLSRDTLRRLERRELTHREARDGLRKWSRRLGRAYRRLSSEAQEVSLQARLEGIFGVRFVGFFENLILWLILGVLVLIFVDMFLPHPNPPRPATAAFVNELVPYLDPPFRVTEAEYRRAEDWQTVHHILAWIDFWICMVFLLEFFTKLALVRGRARWFRNHFLVDLIPSIPLTFVALRAGRLARFLRLPRLIRYVRIARPLARFFQFFGFLQRGVDRMVRLHGGLLNRNIVLFEPVALKAEESDVDVLRHRIRELRVLSRKAWRRHSTVVAPAVRSRRLGTFLDRFPSRDRLLALPESPLKTEAGRVKVLRAEELIDRLTSLDPGTVEAEIGSGSADRIATTLKRLDVPILRHIPGLRPMIRAARAGDELERVAAAGKALGRTLGRLLAFAHWISDLSGVVTGPQFLDRLGTALVQATARPAKRLLMFGFGFLILNGLVHLLGFSALQGIAAWLEKTLGVTFLVLGFSCLVLMFLGVWFRRVAGEATDFYTRTAEAQYINLLKSAKLAYMDEDLETLWERTLRPELLLSGESTERGPEVLRERFEAMRVGAGDQAWSDKVIRLYRDYLDGALFHSSDTKTSEQLLGNLSLEGIRRERLGTWRLDRKRLGRLGLARNTTAVRGPYFWFHSINHSVAQWSAKLILEYNRNAIPLSERETYSETEIDACESWLDKKRSGEIHQPEDLGELTAFRTTGFTALHFLTADAMRDERVRLRFGEQTLAAVQADRQAMVRTIFGSHPFHRHPRADRTLNPFNIYHNYMSGGRGILVPIYILGALFKAFRLVVGRIRNTLKEILSPVPTNQERDQNWASYDVAVRKINRMRRPLFMECARFRGRFDPEYLGLSLFPERESGLEGRTFREDLERIGARDWEWDEFTEIREERAEALLEFAGLVEKAGGPEAFTATLTKRRGPARWREAYRAVALAFAIDYRNLRTLMSLSRRSGKLIREVIEAKGRVPGTELIPRFLRLFLPWRSLRLAFDEFILRYGHEGLSRRERRWVWQAVRANYEGLRRMVRIGASLTPGMTPEEASKKILRQASVHPETWSEQLVTLRIVQSLSVLDIRNYRRQVWILGAYEGSELGETVPASG